MKTIMGDNRRNVKSDNFQFSIISSVRNCLNETKEFIASLRKFSNLLNYELILVDDGSDLET